MRSFLILALLLLFGLLACVHAQPNCPNGVCPVPNAGAATVKNYVWTQGAPAPPNSIAFGFTMSRSERSRSAPACTSL